MTGAVRVDFVDTLGRWGDRPALLVPETSPDGFAAISYAELAGRVDTAAAALGPVRRLVMIAAATTIECVTTYLGALAGGHVVLMVPDGVDAARDRLLRVYDPDIVGCRDGETWTVTERRSGSPHRLHPDLALLLGTSGSTGSPKLVRLSADSVSANARSIAEALGLGPHDRAITTLPLAYCFGLSVLHSHLTVGASVVLSDRSVLDDAFWDCVRDAGVTDLAGVPYTFDLLERAEFSDRDCPDLRLVTQAGGRLAPDRVAAWAAVGERQGWDLRVMYGQTEATARMAVMPAGEAARCPGAVGAPVPGGRVRICAVEATGRADGRGSLDDVEVPRGEIGEVVYEGPNVMLGYAYGPSDLALGRTVHRLRTGDLGRLTEDGLVEITGRLGHVVKVRGVRVDLADVDRLLEEIGLVGVATGRDDDLGVVVACCAHPAMVRSLLASELVLPPSAVQVVAVEELPRTSNGKPDRGAAAALLVAGAVAAGCCASDACPGSCVSASAGRRTASSSRADRVNAPATPTRTPTDQLVALYADLLARDDVSPSSSFTTLGGDSLSFVEVSIRLEETLGRLPNDWASRSIADLAQLGPSGARRRSRWARTDTAVLVRFLAIVAVVGTHAGLFTLRGGAHLLLAVAGYNTARFTFTAATKGAAAGEGLRRTGRALAGFAVPSAAWIATLAAFGVYPWTTAAFLNSLLGPDRWGRAWHFWFVEALVWIVAAVGLLLCLPPVRRQRLSHPFAFALGLVGIGLLPRFGVVHVWTGPERGTPQYVFWLFALGWAVAEASSTRRRLIVSATAAATVPGFFDNPVREGVVLVGVLALIWLPVVRIPRILVPLVGAVAASSLYIYLIQWQVYPPLRGAPAVGLAASLALGVLAWTLTERLRSGVRRRAWPARAIAEAPTRPEVQLQGGRAPRAATAAPTTFGSVRSTFIPANRRSAP